jgi:hypothetical protein
MEPDRFHANTTTLALASTSVLADLEDMDPVKTEFDSLIEAMIREAGFTVVLAGELDNTHVTELVGEATDTATGEPDSARITAARNLMSRELRSKFNADAMLIPTLEVIAVEFTKGRVRWLGASECIPMRWYMPGCGPYEGTTEALVLFVTIIDMDGVVVFRNGGGIQLLRKMPPTLGAGVGLATGGTKLPLVPRDKLFVDKERNVEAVRTALGPLFGTM